MQTPTTTMLLWLCLAGLVASSQGYIWCDRERGCYEVNPANSKYCCEHVSTAVCYPSGKVYPHRGMNIFSHPGSTIRTNNKISLLKWTQLYFNELSELFKFDRDEHCPGLTFFPSQYGLDPVKADPDYFSDTSQGVGELTVEFVGTDFCDDFTTCPGMVKTVQSTDAESGYNFLLSPSGRIYIGLGWDKVVSKDRKMRVGILAKPQQLCNGELKEAVCDILQAFIQCIVDWFRNLPAQFPAPRILIRRAKLLQELINLKTLKEALAEQFCTK